MRQVSSILFAGGILAVATFFHPQSAFGWSAPGHSTIAAEAYRQLPPEYQAQVFDILKAHPDFEKWKNHYHPNPVLDLPETAFLKCSVWPDEIRRSGSPYDHPFWHFIDYPLRPPSFPMEADDRPTNNVIFGITQCEATLGDTNADPRDRAVSLSYLVHLIGDEHQPLHCASYYGDDYTNGDRGGNDFFVKAGDTGVPLHPIWDGLLGNADDHRAEWNYAIVLQNKFPRTSLPELETDATPLSWSLVSRQLAIKFGYLNGNLAGSHTADDAPPLPPDYTKNAKAVAERQGALAGYRLADEIQKCLKWTHDLPSLPANTATADTLPASIGVADASKYYDEVMTVTGKVSQVSPGASITIIRFEQPTGSQPFTAVFFREDTSKFKPLHLAPGQNLQVNGNISEYRNRPEVIVSETNQLTVLSGP